MADIFDAGGFQITFPVFAIQIFEPGRDGFLAAVHPDGEQALALFTDLDQAESFTVPAAAGPSRFRLKEVPGPASLLDLLATAEERGVTHVGFDPGRSPSSPLTSFTLSQMRAYITRWNY